MNTPRHRSRSGSLEIVDELSEEIFRILVLEQKTMTFEPSRGSSIGEEGGKVQAWYIQPEDDEVDEQGVAQRHTDLRLHTNRTADKLQKVLLRSYYGRRIFAEEQGVDLLFLAIGFLKWFEAARSDIERHAPLILIPVTLERQNAKTRFKVRFSEEDITTNLSLQEKLKVEFGLKLPDIPEQDDLSPNAYFQNVSIAVASQPRWEVKNDDIVLWFFSFSKFLMYRDLDPENWPEGCKLDQYPLISRLLGDGFAGETPLCEGDENVDAVIDPQNAVHVLDADSSQSLAIEEVRRGRNLVIQGPPGTGKSQTIANLIASSVKEGKKVLFVAEKMAALEVVKRRLDNIGLGELCLELHSHKATKRAVLDELKRTLELGSPTFKEATELTNLR